MMILVMLAALYIVIALAFEIVISRYYGIVQAAIEMSLIVLLPGFGFFLLLFLHLDIFLFNLRKGSIEPEKDEEEVFSLQDRGYNAEIIPMNDLFLLGDAKMKRKYFTDAIRQDMVSNQNILHKAVYDEDREIAYFAVSLMTAKLQALSNELFHLEQKLKKSPENIPLLKEYAAKLKLFLDSGCEEQMTKNKQQRSYISALAVLNQQFPDQTIYYVERINMLIICGQLEEARKACQEFSAQHADKEEPILMEIKLYQALHDAKKLQERVQALKALPKRLSPEALRIIRFWDKEVVHA